MSAHNICFMEKNTQSFPFIHFTTLHNKATGSSRYIEMHVDSMLKYIAETNKAGTS